MTPDMRTRSCSLALGLLLALSCSDVPQAPVDFESAEHSVFSQYGEDGVIEEIFRRIEPGPKYAVEFGAGDGISLSNTRNLMLNHGWGGLLIEGDPKIAPALRENYRRLPKVNTLSAWMRVRASNR